jgi:hypothetical protein
MEPLNRDVKCVPGEERLTAHMGVFLTIAENVSPTNFASTTGSTKDAESATRTWNAFTKKANTSVPNATPRWFANMGT